MRIIVAMPEGVAAAAEWKARKGIPYTVVAGAEGTPHESVELLRKAFGTLQQCGTVLFDGNGVVTRTQVSTVPTTNYNRTDINAALAALPAIP